MVKLIIPWRIIFAVLGFALSVLGGILGWIILPGVVKEQIKGVSS